MAVCRWQSRKPMDKIFREGCEFSVILWTFLPLLNSNMESRNPQFLSPPPPNSNMKYRNGKTGTDPGRHENMQTHDSIPE